MQSCLLCCWRSVFAMTSAFSWQSSVSLCLASFCILSPNVLVIAPISWLPRFAFQSPIMKRTSFFFSFWCSRKRWRNYSWDISNSKSDAVQVLHSICQQIWKSQQWPQDWKRSVFIPIRKKGSVKECSNYWKIILILHTSKVIPQILQASL